VNGLLLNVIQKAAGGSDDDVDPALEGIHLLAIADATVNDGDAEVGETRVVVDGGFNLGGEFASGFEAEKTRRRSAMGAEFRKDGQAERGGFAGAGLSAADHVPARENQRDRAELNWRRISIAHAPDALHHLRGKSKIIKTHALR
jgi:hypothetical protein